MDPPLLTNFLMILSIGGSKGPLRAPPSHPSSKLWQSCMLAPFSKGSGSAPFGKSCPAFANFLMILSLVDLWGTREPPPSHPTGNFGKVVCWHPFPWGVGSAPSGKSWICHFCKFSHDPFIGGSMGRKRAPPIPPHRKLWQSCMLVPFPRGVGSAPFGKSWIRHFCKFLQITSA